MMKRKVAAADQSNSQNQIQNNSASSARKKQKSNGPATTTTANSKAPHNKKPQPPLNQRDQQQNATTLTNGQQQNGQQGEQEPVWIYGLINNIEQMLSQFNAANNCQRMQQVAAVQQQQQMTINNQNNNNNNNNNNKGHHQTINRPNGKQPAGAKSAAGPKSRSSTHSSGYSTPSSLYSSASLSPPFTSSNGAGGASSVASFNSYSSSSTSNSPTSSLSSQSPGRVTSGSLICQNQTTPTTTSNPGAVTAKSVVQQQQQIPRSPISRQIKFHEYKGPPQTRRPGNQQKQQQQQAGAIKTTSEPTKSANKSSPDCVLVEHKQAPGPQQSIATGHWPETGAQPTVDQQQQQLQTVSLMAPSQPVQCQNQKQELVTGPGRVVMHCAGQHQTAGLVQRQHQGQIQGHVQLSQGRLVIASTDMLGQGQVKHTQVSLVRQQQQQVQPSQEPSSCQMIHQHQQQRQEPQATICYESRVAQPHQHQALLQPKQQQQPAQHVSLQMIRTPNGNQQQVLVLDPIAFQHMQQQQQHHHHQIFNHNQQCDQQKTNLIFVQQQAPILPNQAAQTMQQQTMRLHQPHQHPPQQQQSNAYNTLINNDNFYTQQRQQPSQHQQAEEPSRFYVAGGDSSQINQVDQMEGEEIEYNQEQMAPRGYYQVGGNVLTGQQQEAQTVEGQGADGREFMIESSCLQQDQQPQQQQPQLQQQVVLAHENQFEFQQQPEPAGPYVANENLSSACGPVYENDQEEDDTSEIEPTISFEGEHCNGQPFDENLLFSEFIDLQDIPLNVDESDWLRKFLPPCSTSSSSPAISTQTNSTMQTR